MPISRLQGRTVSTLASTVDNEMSTDVWRQEDVYSRLTVLQEKP